MALLAPFGLLRIAASRIGELVETAPPETTRLVNAAADEADRAASLRVALDTALFLAIPTLGTRARRTALELKRCVHNNRQPNVLADAIDQVRDVLSEQDREVLATWLKHQQRATALLQAAEVALRDELETHVRPRLSALAARESFQRALVLASPTLYADLATAAKGTSPVAAASRLDRSVLLYLARAAAKCSPFSVFMHQGVVELGSGGHRLPEIYSEARTSMVSVDLGLLFGLRRAALLLDPETPSLTANRSMRRLSTGGIVALVAGYVVFRTHVLRLSRLATFRMHPHLSSRIVALPDRFSGNYLQHLLVDAGLPPEDAFDYASRLIGSGLVEAWPAHDRGARALSAIRSLETAAAELPDAPASRRHALLCSARRAIADAPVAAPVDASRFPLLWEDGIFPQPLGPAGQGIDGLLQELAVQLRQDAVLTAPYRAIRDLFVEQFGSGGQCRNIIDFLSGAATALAARRWWSADPDSEAPAPPGVPVPVTTTVQFDAADAESLASGNATVVLNEVFPGCGWLSARHALGDTEHHRRLRRLLTEWLATANAPAEPVEVALSCDCNGLQAHPPLTRRVLAWPTEPPANPSVAIPLAVDALVLRHDPGTGLLEVWDLDRRRIVLTYVGTTVPNPAWGMQFWLTTLSWPFRIRRTANLTVPPVGSSVGLVELPRRRVGRALLSRAAWWMRSDRILRCWFSHEGASRLHDVLADRRRVGMPRRVFVRPGRDAALRTGNDNKPLWIDTAHPFCLDVLSRLAQRVPWLLLTEALPDQPVWPELDSGGHVSELLVEMLV